MLKTQKLNGMSKDSPVRKSKKTKFLAMMLVLMFALSNIAGASVIGGSYSDSATKNHNGSSSRLMYNVVITFPNGVNKVKMEGSSSMAWLGATPYTADSIQLTNTVKVNAVGGVSFSSTGGGVSTSGSSMSDQMTVTNTWWCNSNFTYNANASLFILSANFAVSGRTQIGSGFYSLSMST